MDSKILNIQRYSEPISIPGIRVGNETKLYKQKNLYKLLNNYDSVFFSQHSFVTSDQFKKFTGKIAYILYRNLQSLALYEDENTLSKVLYGEDAPTYLVIDLLMEDATDFIIPMMNDDVSYTVGEFISDIASSDIFPEQWMKDAITKRLSELIPHINDELAQCGFGGGRFVSGARMTTGDKDRLRKGDTAGACYTPLCYNIVRCIKQGLIKLILSDSFTAASPEEQIDMCVNTVAPFISKAMNALNCAKVASSVYFIYDNDYKKIYIPYIKTKLGIEEYIPGIVTDIPDDQFDDDKQDQLKRARAVEDMINTINSASTEGNDHLHLHEAPLYAIRSALTELCIDLIRKEYLSENGITNASNFCQRAMPGPKDIPVITANFLKLYYEKLSSLLCSLTTPEFYSPDADDIRDKVDSVISNITENAAKTEREADRKVEEVAASIHIKYGEDIARLEQKIAELNKCLKEKEHEVIAEKTASMILESQLDSLKTQHKNLSVELDNANQLISDMSDSIENPLNDADEEFLCQMTEKRILFVRKSQASGHRIMSEIQKRLPHAKFTSFVSSKNDVQSYDLVVLMTRYLPHSTYYKARDLTKMTDGVKVIHCDSVSMKGIIDTLRKAEEKQTGSAYVAVGRHTTNT